MTTRSRDAARELVRLTRFTPTASYQRFAYGCAALLVASGAFHAAVLLVDGGSWEGPVSWRKPIVFGLSFGVTVVTLAWMLGFLHPRRAVAWIVVSVLAVASIGEVALISLPSPLRLFSQDTARRNAARAISVVAERRSEREEVERLLAHLYAEQHTSVG